MAVSMFAEGMLHFDNVDLDILKPLLVRNSAAAPFPASIFSSSSMDF
jgi:hypothetical protein